MPVPRSRTSKSKKNMRRSHHALSALNLCPCPKCSAPRLPHSVCETCGTYRDRTVAKRYLKADLSVG